jgi:hypothetical protein
MRIPTPVEMDLHEWWTDHDEVLAFARWYWDGAAHYPTCPAREILDYFEKPWKWSPEYEGYKEEQAEFRREQHNQWMEGK